MSDADATTEVVVRGGTDPAVSVRLVDLKPFYDEVAFTVSLHADGLTAKLDRTTITPWDSPQLDDFFAQLAADYAGWDDVRTWRSNHLAIDARFRSGGHVALTWTVQNQHFTEDRWQAKIDVVVEAGEQMANLAADIRSFLRAGSRA